MIKAFSKITGTGKFYHYHTQQLPDRFTFTEFGQFNLIYGPNGSGKTTLAQIFRSLKGNDTLLLQKRSFNKKQAQTVEVQTDLPDFFRFEQNKWNAHYPHLAIFDVFFIDENIYTGLEIQTNHKKKLFDIILGEGGIQLKEAIQQIKVRIRNGNKIVRDTTQLLEKEINHAFSAAQYAALQADPAIDKRIAAKQKELETAQDFQQIVAQSVLWKLPAIDLPFDFNALKTLLESSIDNISNKYLEQVKAHKTHLNMDNSEEWLKQGFAAIQDDTCPFCSQNLDKVSIIEAYQQYFNATYAALQATIQQTNQAMQSFNLELILLDIKRKIINNEALVIFWKNHVPNAPELQVLEDEQAELLAAFEKLKTIVQAKAANPIQAQEVAILEQMEEKWTAMTSQLNAFNEAILSYNVSISLLKTTQTTDLPQLELELKQLQAWKKRDEEHIIEYCDNLLVYQNALAKLAAMKEQKQSELNIFKDSIFRNYLTKINHYLKAFAPYLEIRNLSSVYMGSSTEPSVKFALHVHGNVVHQKEHATKISMKYALSEGDKSALALAFFFAKLDLDEQLADKVIVFDDAISSFDRQRIATLLEVLMDFGKRAKQVFFSTHNSDLLRAFWQKMTERELDGQAYRIAFVGESSQLVSFDMGRG